jgi:hypothetical protein
VLRVIAKKEKFTNFDVVFIPNPFQSVIDKWLAEGREVFELVEPVDSLHPTQVIRNPFQTVIDKWLAV